MKEESDEDNKAKAFDFVIESQKSEIKVGKKECKKGEESDKSVREGKEKGVKKTGGSWVQRRSMWQKYLKRTET